jgi:hypothetical protein
MTFDDRVALIRSGGVAPKCIRRKKSDCTPEQWAAHREYMAARYRDPRCRAMHARNQLRYLARAARAIT